MDPLIPAWIKLCRSLFAGLLYSAKDVHYSPILQFVVVVVCRSSSPLPVILILIFA